MYQRTVPGPSSAQRLAAYLLLIAPFMANDLAFIALDGTYGVYLADYATRALVIAVCVAWPISRAILGEAWRTPAPLVVLALAAVALMPVDYIAVNLVKNPLDELIGWDGLFHFGAIDSPVLNWLDLTLGLVLVAVSEEIVYRKLALSWLSSVTNSKVAIIAISAVFFSFAHWGGGPGQMASTFLVGAVFMAAYLQLGKLWPLMVAHFVANFIEFV